MSRRDDSRSSRTLNCVPKLETKLTMGWEMDEGTLGEQQIPLNYRVASLLELGDKLTMIELAKLARLSWLIELLRSWQIVEFLS